MNCQKTAPRLIVIAGPNGTGKTSLTQKALQHQWLQGCVYINPDNIARDDFGDWNDPSAVMKAANKADELRESCLAQRQDFAFETVLSTSAKLDFLKRAKDSGYFIRLFFVGTSSPIINAARIAARLMEGGHGVPLPKVISRYAKSVANCASAAEWVDRTYIYDNSVDDREAELIFRASNGKLVKVYRMIPLWAAEIAKAVDQGCSK